MADFLNFRITFWVIYCSSNCKVAGSSDSAGSSWRDDSCDLAGNSAVGAVQAVNAGKKS